jgi:hypothetical protein
LIFIISKIYLNIFGLEYNSVMPVLRGGLGVYGSIVMYHKLTQKER